MDNPETLKTEHTRHRTKTKQTKQSYSEDLGNFCIYAIGKLMYM